MKPLKNIKIIHPLFILFFVFILAILLIVPLFRFWQYETFYYDFGIYDQTISKMAKFQAPIVDKLDLGKTNFFADHLTFSFIFFIPFFWLFPRIQEFLLIIQSLSVWLAGIIAYLIIRKKINHLAVLALCFAFYYFLGLQNAVITDFHPMPVAILPLMLMFWAIYNKKKYLYWFFLIVFLGFKENLGFYSFFVGLWLVFKNQKKQGLLTIFLSLIYSFGVIYFVIPVIGKQAYLYPPAQYENIFALIKAFVWPLEKLKTFLITFASFGFIPILFWPLSLGIITDLFFRFCLNLAPSRWTIGMQYNALYPAFLLIASFEILKFIKKKWGKKAQVFYALFILISTLFIHKFYHGPFGLFFNKVFWQNTTKQEFMIDFISQIPRSQGLLMAQNNIAVRFARQNVVLLRKNYQDFDPDIIVIDFRGGQNSNNFYPLKQEEVAVLLEKIKADTGYKNIYNKEDNRYIFVKNIQK